LKPATSLFVVVLKAIITTMRFVPAVLLVHLTDSLVSSFQPASRAVSRRILAGDSNSRHVFSFYTTATSARGMTTTTSLPEFGTPTYGITKKLPGKNFDEVVDSVTAELKKNGFGVLTKIDMKETMKKKLDVDFERPYVILGACNPKLAHNALQSLPSIGLFLPCNVVVAQDPEDGGIVVSVISPKEMFSVVDTDDENVSALADDVQETMTKVIDAL
jgi:uncharacterized protein (DUF302 family)